METTHPSTRKLYRKKDIEKRARESKWLKLEILFASENFVEFRAFYQDKAGKIHEHHEKSNFVFEGGKWFFE